MVGYLRRVTDLFCVGVGMNNWPAVDLYWAAVSDHVMKVEMANAVIKRRWPTVEQFEAELKREYGLKYPNVIELKAYKD